MKLRSQAAASESNEVDLDAAATSANNELSVCHGADVASQIDERPSAQSKPVRDGY